MPLKSSGPASPAVALRNLYTGRSLDYRDVPESPFKYFSLLFTGFSDIFCIEYRQILDEIKSLSTFYFFSSTKKSPGQSTTSDNEVVPSSFIVGRNNLDYPSPRGTDEYSSDDYYSTVDVEPSATSRGGDCTLCGETIIKMRRDYYQYWICNLCSKAAVANPILYKRI
uniref:Uncharacterized protein n=1 Tax=Romanomermis culicivorax TaxID=13658 RepID=A0A915HX17_ROMCU